jgi:hypothetical protein
MKEPQPPLPPAMADKIVRMKSASDNLEIPVPIDWMANRENLRAAVYAASRDLSDIECRGDSLLTFPIALKIAQAKSLFLLPSQRLS